MNSELSRSILECMELHNVAAPEVSASGVGWLLPRFPVKVRQAQESPGFYISRESSGIELRFTTSALHFRVFLSAEERDINLSVFYGDNLLSAQILPRGVASSVHCAPPAHFDKVKPEALRAGRFRPGLWRLACDGGTLNFLGADAFGAVFKKPGPEDKPALRWLAYGSSITHSDKNGYVQQAAARLGVDVSNKGMSGSCYIEPAVADYLSAGCNWDFATFELGINMRSRFSVEEFGNRARYLVESSIKAKPGRPIFLISVFPNQADYEREPSKEGVVQEGMRESLRKLAAEFSGKGVRLVEGADVLKDLSYLSADLVHPREMGQVLMGENLAAILRPEIEKLKQAKM